MIIRKGSVPTTDAVSGYPDPYNLGAGNISWQALSEAGGLTQYGVYMETLHPGGTSSQMHWESEEDEFLYMLSGELTLIEDGVESQLSEGDACAWKAGGPPAHHLKNHTDAPATYLIIGSRNPNNVTHYPELDMLAKKDGFYHLDGTKYPDRESKT
ncbi:MAG: cupin domain-containing protein [Pseudomonadota bacterium]